MICTFNGEKNSYCDFLGYYTVYSGYDIPTGV